MNGKFKRSPGFEDPGCGLIFKYNDSHPNQLLIEELYRCYALLDKAIEMAEFYEYIEVIFIQESGLALGPKETVNQSLKNHARKFLQACGIEQGNG